MKTDTMPLVVTIVTPGYEAMAREAVRRFRLASGCEAVMILDVPEGQGFHAKMALDLLCPARPIVFVDADLWMLRTFDIRDLMPDGDEWIGVHDPAVFGAESWPGLDCKNLGMNPLGYVNTGLFGCDLSNGSVRLAFSLARKLREEHGALMKDPTDQGWINLALQNLSLPVRMLPSVFNFWQLAVQWGYQPCIPRGIIGLHAAGYAGADKLGALQTQALAYGGDFKPMSAAAMAAHHSATYELR